MEFFKKITKELGVSNAKSVLLIIVFVISGIWVAFIPILLIIVFYNYINQKIDNKILRALLSYYGVSVIMSSCGLLIFYFPDAIGGLFESGYILADFITLNNIFDVILKIETDSWGIVYNWIIIASFLSISILRFRFSKY